MGRKPRRGAAPSVDAGRPVLFQALEMLVDYVCGAESEEEAETKRAHQEVIELAEDRDEVGDEIDGEEHVARDN